MTFDEIAHVAYTENIAHKAVCDCMVNKNIKKGPAIDFSHRFWPITNNRLKAFAQAATQDDYIYSFRLNRIHAGSGSSL
jgi:hypothetical protein